MDKQVYRRTIAEACAEIESHFADNIFISYKSTDYTYSQIMTLAGKRAQFLIEKGYGKGDVIGILAPNSPEWCISFLAISMIGGITLPMDTGLDHAMYNIMCERAGVKICFVSPDMCDRINNTQVFEIQSQQAFASSRYNGKTEGQCDEIAVMLFTSGTTGTPKIVSLTHANILHIAYVCTDLEKYTQQDQTLAILPLFHVYAFEATFMAPFVSGSRIVLHTSLKGPDIMAALAAYNITIFPAAPLMWELFFDGMAAKAKAKSKNAYRVFMFCANYGHVLRCLGLGFVVRKIFAPVRAAFGNSHRFFISGGAPLKREYFRYYKNMGFNIMEGYGLSETTGPIAIPYYLKAKPASVGTPIEGNEAEIRNRGEDGIGEIWLRGDAVMPGYFNNEAGNREVFDEQGFFNTGDLGRMDRDGYLYITGRKKNVIVLDSGKNVYPEEIEFFFRQSELIADIAVFEWKNGGRAVVYAVIVPAGNGRECDYDTIADEISRLNKMLPSYKKLGGFAISREDLPRNSAKKLLYDMVKQRLTQGLFMESGNSPVTFKDEVTAKNDREIKVLEVMCEVFATKALYQRQNPVDLGVDSLGLIECAVAIEQKLGVSVDLDRFTGQTGFGDMLSYLSGLPVGDRLSTDFKILRDEIKTKPLKHFNPLHHIGLGCAGQLSRLFWGLSVKNRERLQQPQCIIAPNHQSYLDMVWIAWALAPGMRRNVYVTAKSYLRVLRYFFPVLPVIYLDDTNALDVLKANADLLRQGKTLVIFPEGTRTKDGQIGEFQSGAAYLSWHLGVPLLPVSIKGAFEIWPRTRTLPALFCRKKASLNIGEPINPAKFEGVDELNEALKRAVVDGMK